MQPKKIAFVGCSHLSTHDQPTQGKNNWTYQLYKKFPKHQYRSYSRGGQGIEHFQWHLLDAKKWGADIVFMNRTYPGRWAKLTQSIDWNVGFEYTSNDKVEEDNWKEILPIYEHYWGTVNDDIRCYSPAREITKIAEEYQYSDENAYRTAAILNKAQPYWKLYSGSDIRLKWEIEWYSNVENLYNFDNLFLIDWDRTTHGYEGDSGWTYPTTSTTWDTAVEYFFEKKYGIDKSDKKLWSVGIQTSEEDNHFSPRGNRELLNEYILTNKKVLDAIIK